MVLYLYCLPTKTDFLGWLDPIHEIIKMAVLLTDWLYSVNMPIK